MLPSMACVACENNGLVSSLPFVLYWLILFPIWGFLFAAPIAVMARQQKQTLPMQPLWYFAGFLVLFFLTGGDILPLLLVVPIALLQIGACQLKLKKLEKPPTGIVGFAYRINLIFLVVCLLGIPLGFLRLWLQKHS